jgi:hypothetical protein
MDEGRAVLEHLAQRVLDDDLGLSVHIGSRLVEDEDARLRHDSSGEADQLTLA